MKAFSVALVFVAALPLSAQSLASQALTCSKGTTNLSCPATVNGTLTSADCQLQSGGGFDQYAIALPEAPFTATVTGASTVPLVIMLTDPVDGDVFQSSSGFGSASISYTPPDPGLVYTLIVGTTSTASSSYTLSVTCSAPSECDWSGELTCPTTVHASLDFGQCTSTSGRYYFDYYKLPLTTGQTVQVVLTGTEGMRLYIDEPGFTSGVYSDTGSNTQTILFTAARTAVHQLSVSSNDAYATPSYDLTVTCSNSPCGKTRVVRH